MLLLCIIGKYTLYICPCFCTNRFSIIKSLNESWNEFFMVVRYAKKLVWGVNVRALLKKRPQHILRSFT